MRCASHVASFGVRCANAAVALVACGAAFAQASAPPARVTLNLEESLFVLRPKPDIKGGIHVLWISQPVQKYCLGKTAQECSTTDYRIRTTDKDSSMCRTSGLDITRLPVYPPDMRPRRVLSLTYFPVAEIRGSDALQKFFEAEPKETLDHLYLRMRIVGATVVSVASIPPRMALSFERE